MSTKFAEGITSKPLVQCNARRVYMGRLLHIDQRASITRDISQNRSKDFLATIVVTEQVNLLT